MKTNTHHFSIGDGINNLIRQGFWYEGKFKWANDCLDCFKGITEKQKDMILNGDAFLKSMEDGSSKLVIEKDMEFKSKMKEHQEFIAHRIPELKRDIGEVEIKISRLRHSGANFGNRQGQFQTADELEESNKGEIDTLILFENCREKYEDMNSSELLPPIDNVEEITKTINLAGHKVPEDLLEEYTKHVVKRLRGSLRMVSLGLPAIDDYDKIQALEQRRQELHGLILDSIGLARKDEKYFEFSKALEKYLEDNGAGLVLGEKKCRKY